MIRSSSSKRSVVLFTVAMFSRVGMTILGAGALTMVAAPGAGATAAPMQKVASNLAHKLTGKAAPAKAATNAAALADPAPTFGCRASLARVELPPPTVLLEPVIANDQFAPCVAEDPSVIGTVDLSPIGSVTLLETDTILDRHQPAQVGDNAQAIAKVADVKIDVIPGVPIRAQLITAEAGVTCDSNNQPKFGGGTALVSLDISGQLIELPPPNTVIPLGPLGSITLREEITGAHGVEERAIAVRTPIVNVFVAEATAGVIGNPCTPDTNPCTDHDNDADDTGCPPCGHTGEPTCPPCVPDNDNNGQAECPPCDPNNDPNDTCPPAGPCTDHDNDADDTGCPPCGHSGEPSCPPCVPDNDNNGQPECPTCDPNNDPNDTCPPPGPCTDHDNDADDTGCPPCGHSGEPSCPPCVPDNDNNGQPECPQPCTDHDGDSDDTGCPPCGHTGEPSCPPCVPDNDGDHCPPPPPCTDHDGDSDDTGCPPCGHTGEPSCPPCQPDNDGDHCPPPPCTGDEGDRDSDNCCPNSDNVPVNCCEVPDHNQGDAGDDDACPPGGCTSNCPTPCDASDDATSNASVNSASAQSSDDNECACEEDTASSDASMSTASKSSDDSSGDECGDSSDSGDMSKSSGPT